MGAIISTIKFTYEIVRELVASYSDLNRRLALSPGLPLPNPTTPFWAIPPASISAHGAHDALPASADVVVIGSGIAGISFAREFLDSCDGARSVVMLEARDVCSGATARNGGHITPQLYHAFRELEQAIGKDAAKCVIRFRRSHLSNLLRVAEEEGLLEQSQCRQVDTYDAFFEPCLFETMKDRLAYFLTAMPEEQPLWSVMEGPKVAHSLQLCENVCGAIATKGGAIHPYRLVTGILARLLKSHSSLSLFTHTPCTSIETSSNGYLVHTPRGIIQAKHIVHATNGWASHLLPQMRRKIIPLRGHMSAQRPGTGLGQLPDDSSQLIIRPNWLGTRSFVLYPSESEDRWDYLTQQPSNPSLGGKPHAEMMFGASVDRQGPSFMDAIACVDDSRLYFPMTAHINGALATYFGSWWGAESTDEDEGFDSGRVKKVWTGIMGVSGDAMPWVGKLPKKISDRASVGDDAAEWIVAGFNGEGMTHAWMSGKALALMMLGREAELSPWFPQVFTITEKRWKKVSFP